MTRQAGLIPLFQSECIEGVKLSAGCSNTEQPNDLMSSHRTVHAADTSEPGHPSPAMEKYLTDVFDHTSIPAASRSSFRNHLSHFEELMRRAFNPDSIRKGISFYLCCLFFFAFFFSFRHLLLTGVGFKGGSVLVLTRST